MRVVIYEDNGSVAAEASVRNGRVCVDRVAGGGWSQSTGYETPGAMSSTAAEIFGFALGRLAVAADSQRAAQERKDADAQRRLAEQQRRAAEAAAAQMEPEQ